ncbi:tetratricopeptide repeat protein [Candidatus Dependentiae bacterium]|nr:tetratricopeptide repeat protein [Candidatus Dependentiae bacterium]
MQKLLKLIIVFLLFNSSVYAMEVEEKLPLISEYNLPQIYEEALDFYTNGEDLKAFQYFKKLYEISLNNIHFHAIAANWLGTLYFDGFGVPKDNLTALKYASEAYRLGTNDVNIRATSAKQLGEIYLKFGDLEKARKYFEESYKIQKNKEIRAFSANELGIIYFEKIKNYKEARKYFEDAYSLGTPDIRSVAASNLGLIHLLGLNVNKDFEKARKYFYEAIQGQRPEIVKANNDNLLLMKKLLLDEFDEQLEKIKNLHPSTSMKNIMRYIKSAGQKLEEVNDIKLLNVELNNLIESIVKEKHEELDKVENQIRQRKQEEKKPLTSEQQIIKQQTADLMKSAEEMLKMGDLVNTEKLLKDLKNFSIDEPAQQNQVKNLNKQYKEKKLSNLFNEFEELFESFSKKTSRERAKRLENILYEATMLASNNSEIMEIREKHKKLSSLMSKEEEEILPAAGKEEVTQEPYLVLDPFDQKLQIPENLTVSIESHLQDLAADPFNVRNAEKLKSLEDTWRIRVGNYRILYTILPKYNALGIVSIDARKTVYESEEADKNREKWFRELNVATPTQILAEISKEEDPGKLRVLKELYAQINKPKD